MICTIFMNTNTFLISISISSKILKILWPRNNNLFQHTEKKKKCTVGKPGHFLQCTSQPILYQLYLLIRLLACSCCFQLSLQVKTASLSFSLLLPINLYLDLLISLYSSTYARSALLSVESL